jgi:hypothetical protein
MIAKEAAKPNSNIDNYPGNPKPETEIKNFGKLIMDAAYTPC